MHKADLVSTALQRLEMLSDRSFSRDNDSQHPKCLVSYHVEESKEVRTVVWRDIYGDVIKHMSTAIITIKLWLGFDLTHRSSQRHARNPVYLPLGRRC